MIENNIKIIREKISKVCSECNRNSKDIKLVAVSKQKPIESILEAQDAGLNDFGENRAQEFKEKSSYSPDDINWHFIGHLQKNKVKDVVKNAYLIHSVDSRRLAEEIDKRAGNIGKIQNILLEVNTSGEESKFGLRDENDVFELAEYCANLPNIRLQGLMTMAPWTNDEELIQKSFASLRNIFIKLKNMGFSLTELSMGMTNDYETAIKEGATILRIGTAIFGTR